MAMAEVREPVRRRESMAFPLGLTALLCMLAAPWWSGAILPVLLVGPVAITLATVSVAAAVGGLVEAGRHRGAPRNGLGVAFAIVALVLGAGSTALTLLVVSQCSTSECWH